MKALGVIALAALALAAPAAAQDTLLDRTAAELRSDPVYVHPDTNLVEVDDEQRIERAIDDEARGPLFIAVLPAAAREEAGGTTADVALRLGRLVEADGVYAVVVGNQFRAVSTDLGRDQAGALATRAFLTHQDEGVPAVLLDFVQRVGAVRERSAASESEDSGGGGFPTWLLAVGGAIAAFFGFRALRRRRERERELADVKAVAREDLVALADDVVGLDEEVERPSARPEAREAYVRAMEAYQRADDSFDRARSTRELAKVSSAMAEARFEMETAKARLAGRPPPEPRPPCFFDPRHGPSTRDVSWEAPYGGWVQVPACESDALRVETGQEPDVREVPVDGRRRPYWDAPAYYGPWAGGFYGGGLLPGLLIGSALGTTMGAPQDAYASSSDSWDSGDFGGGGDFGGDFGGGGDF
jgi:hypothetical protein